MTNWENVEKVLDAIDSDPKGFHMATFENPSASCGTTRCIAGWAYVLATGENVLRPVQQSTDYNPWPPARSIITVANEYLGIEGPSTFNMGIYDPDTFETLCPSTDEIRAKIKEMYV